MDAYPRAARRGAWDAAVDGMANVRQAKGNFGIRRFVVNPVRIWRTIALWRFIALQQFWADFHANCCECADVQHAICPAKRWYAGAYPRSGFSTNRHITRSRGRKPSLTAKQVENLRERVAAGEKKAGLAREFGISRETLYAYLHE
jgi:hypothetical protein